MIVFIIRRFVGHNQPAICIMEWWINLLKVSYFTFIMFYNYLLHIWISKVIGKTVMLMVMSAFMRLQYWINPSAKQRDLEKLGISGNGKYDPDPESVTSNYLWTWKLISKRFARLMQDINKVNSNFLLVLLINQS